MIRALLRDVEAPVFGYETVTMDTRADGYHEIYLYPFGQAQHIKREENHVGDCNTRDDASVFCGTILDCLDGPLPVLAAVRTGIETPFLRQVMQHPNVRCIDMDPERFDEIYRELQPVVQSWDCLFKRGGNR